nr:immunoglobulin light chain junction region [Macaca mulatta]MOX58189.1 immunoglobulin light chain junction region [Macaca mulatta]
CMQYRYIPPTF